MLYNSFLTAIYFIYGSVYTSVKISQLISPPFFHSGSIHPFSVSVSLVLALEIGSSVPFFSKFYIHVLIYNIYFSLTHVTLYDTFLSLSSLESVSLEQVSSEGWGQGPWRWLPLLNSWEGSWGTFVLCRDCQPNPCRVHYLWVIFHLKVLDL